ncbi:MAG: hypothetical protein ACI835_003847 [Planctomycetota bacterium]|jgi:hypothetical protein
MTRREISRVILSPAALSVAQADDATRRLTEPAQHFGEWLVQLLGDVFTAVGFSVSNRLSHRRSRTP